MPPARLATALAVLLCAPALAAPRTLAIAYFDNDTGQAELDPLKKGLADMLITDLFGLDGLVVVEREKLNQVLAELSLSKSAFIDPRTAQKLGKGLAAQYLLTGAYTLGKGAMRVDARVLEVQSGKVVATQKVEGKQDEFFAIEKELVELLVKTLELKLGLKEKNGLQQNQTESWEAWRKYSAGLDARDRGDEARARTLFQAALEADPAYRRARSALEKARVLVARETARQDDEYATRRAALDPHSKTFAQDVFALLSASMGGNGQCGSESENLQRKVELLTWLAQNDLRPVLAPPSRGQPEALGLLDVTTFSQYDPEVVEALPAVCQYVLEKYPANDYVNAYKARLRDVEKQIAALHSDPAGFARYWAAREANEPKNPCSAGWITERPALHRLIRLIEKKMKR